MLGLDWSEVDAEAEALEHAISPRLEQALAAHLGEPLEDPHGHPIPTAAGELHHRELQRLSEFRAGQSRAHPRGPGRQPGPPAPLAATWA